MNKIRVVSSALFSSLVFLSSGCSVFIKPLPDSAYRWYHSGQEPMEMQIHLVSQSDVQALCCNTQGFVMACAWRDYEKKECKVFTSFKNLPEETLLHEQRHCDGWEHQVFNSIQASTQAANICKTLEEVLDNQE